MSNELYEEVKLKDFESQNELTGLEKGNIVSRVNKRLSIAIKNNKVTTVEEAEEYKNKQIKKLDKKSKKHTKENKTGMFTYEWADDIYKDYAYLGAEINKMDEYSKFNKALINKIKIYEKTGKKPSKDVVENFVSSLNSRMDKEALNDSEILRRKSIENILNSVMESETDTLPYVKENKDIENNDDIFEKRTIILLRLDASNLSFSETRALKDLFEFEEDATSNTLFIEGGIVQTGEDDPALIYYEDVARKNIVEFIIEHIKEHGFIYQKNDVQTFLSRAEENCKETERELKSKFNKKEKEIKKIPFYQKNWFLNSIIYGILISIIAIIIYNLMNYF